MTAIPCFRKLITSNAHICHRIFSHEVTLTYGHLKLSLLHTYGSYSIMVKLMVLVHCTEQKLTEDALYSSNESHTLARKISACRTEGRIILTFGHIIKIRWHLKPDHCGIVTRATFYNLFKGQALLTKNGTLFYEADCCTYVHRCVLGGLNLSLAYE
jgi:hypothetical protein